MKNLGKFFLLYNYNMPSLGTPHAASKAAPADTPLELDLVAYGVANYSASTTQYVQLGKNAGTTSNAAGVCHNAYPITFTYAAPGAAAPKQVFANAVAKKSTALKGLDGGNNVMSQYNVTFNDTKQSGFASMMLNNITKDKIRKEVLKVLKKLVPALKRNADAVDLAGGAVTGAGGSLGEFIEAEAYGAYDAETGECRWCIFKSPDAVLKTAPTAPDQGGIIGYAIGNYEARNIQSVGLERDAGTTTNEPAIKQIAFISDIVMEPGNSLNPGSRRMTAETVSKISTALKSLNGDRNASFQNNLTLTDKGTFGYVANMHNDTTADKIHEPVLKLLKKLVPALKRKPEEVNLGAGAATAAVGSFSRLQGTSSYIAYNAENGQAAQVWYRDPR